jgi:hypothetical protein
VDHTDEGKKPEAIKAPSDLIKVPESFKKYTKWWPWKVSFVTYLNLKYGQASTILAYIIREYDDPLPNVAYRNTHDELVAGSLFARHRI